MAVRFVLNGSAVEVAEAEAHLSLLSFLRSRGLCGSKEGCAEGECGACAVALLVSDPAEPGSHFEAVNGCLLPVLALGGREVVSVEGIAAADGALHPVQQAMVAAGGSQCGYCTPGFVVSLFCEYYRPGRSGFEPESISGNLCRCTGYRPIADVARQLPTPADDDARLVQLGRRAPAPAPAAEANFVRPTSLMEACEILRRDPAAVPIAGGTDLIVYANQRHQRFERLVSLEGLSELQELSVSEAEIVIGAGVTLARLERWLHDGQVPLLAQLLPSFSSRLIRHRATLGGNLATASPIGDAAPVLLALDAALELVSESGSRTLALRDFFVGYRKSALAAGELIRAVRIAKPLPRYQRFYKVSKRVLDDISTVAGAFTLTLDDRGAIARLGVGLGGVAATPLTAPSLEALAHGRRWDEDTLQLLVAATEQLGTPQSDLRGSARYRRALLGNLLRKFYFETTSAAEAAE